MQTDFINTCFGNLERGLNLESCTALSFTARKYSVINVPNQKVSILQLSQLLQQGLNLELCFALFLTHEKSSTISVPKQKK